MLIPISLCISVSTCIFQGVMQMERQLHGRLLDKPKQIPFQDGGQNLCLTIEELAPGWRSKLAANYQVGTGLLKYHARLVRPGPISFRTS